MERFLLKRPSMGDLAFHGVALLLSLLAGAAILVWRSPLTPIFVGGTVIAVILSLRALQKPLITLYMTLFLCLMPFKFGFDYIYDPLRNMMLALALGGWLLQIGCRKQQFVWNATYGLIVLYMAWACVTLLWAPDLIESRRKLVAYGMGLILLLLIGNQIRSKNALDGVMRVFAIVGWIMVVAGIYSVAFVGVQFGDRLKVFEVNENQFGTFLILMLPGVIWPVLCKPERVRSLHMLLSVVYILCTIVLVALSGSRGSAISLILVLLAFWFWKPLRPWGMVGAVVVSAMLFMAPFLLGTLQSRFEAEEAGDLGGRGTLWQASILLIRDYPWSGAGVGNGPQQLNWYVLSLRTDRDPKQVLPSHNPILEAGVDTGILGIAIYVGVLASALWRFFRFRNRWYMQRGALAAYFPLILGTSIGFLATWIKGGGMEVNLSYFILLALLLVPSHLSPGLCLDVEHPIPGDPIGRLRALPVVSR